MLQDETRFFIIIFFFSYIFLIASLTYPFAFIRTRTARRAAAASAAEAEAILAPRSTEIDMSRRVRSRDSRCEMRDARE